MLTSIEKSKYLPTSETLPFPCFTPFHTWVVTTTHHPPNCAAIHVMKTSLHSLLTGRPVKAQFSVLVIGDTSCLADLATEQHSGESIRRYLSVMRGLRNARCPAGSVLKAVLASLRPSASGEDVLSAFLKEVFPAPSIQFLPPRLLSKEKAVAK